MIVAVVIIAVIVEILILAKGGPNFAGCTKRFPNRTKLPTRRPRDHGAHIFRTQASNHLVTQLVEPDRLGRCTELEALQPGIDDEAAARLEVFQA